MGGGGQPEHNDRRGGVAKTRDRSSPIRFVLIRGPFLDSHQLAPFDQTMTRPTMNYVMFQRAQRDLSVGAVGHVYRQ